MDSRSTDASESIARAVALLQAGGVVAIPTDTVYGIAASIEHPEAIERIFAIKGRAGTKALPVLVSDAAQLDRFGVEVSDDARALAARFWPGALTLVVQAASWVPAVILRGGTTVGLRMPASDDARAIIAGAGGALAVTSANRSGDPEARSADEVARVLGERLDAIVDGGPSPSGAPSTVVDASAAPARILRAGALDVEQLRAVCADVR